MPALLWKRWGIMQLQGNQGCAFLSGVSLIDFIQKIWTFFFFFEGKSSGKGSCNSLLMYWGWWVVVEEILWIPATVQPQRASASHLSISSRGKKLYGQHSVFLLKAWHKFKVHLKSDGEPIRGSWQQFCFYSPLMCRCTLSAFSPLQHPRHQAHASLQF